MMAIETKPPAGPATEADDATNHVTSWSKTEEEMSFWCGGADAAIGLSGTGFEGGAVSVWDEIRSTRAHGFHVCEDGRVLSSKSGRTSQRHRRNVEYGSRVDATMADVSEADKRVIVAAWATCNAERLVVNHFSGRNFQAPMIGLALVAWYDMKPDETRAPHAVIHAWAEIVTRSGGVLGKVRDAAHARYWPVVTRYELKRREREKARRDAARADREKFLATLRGMA